MINSPLLAPDAKSRPFMGWDELKGVIAKIARKMNGSK
jgi:hypothetical protein